MELEILVKEFSPWLVAAAPYLIQARDLAGEEFIKNASKEAATKLGETVWNGVKAIWNKLLSSEAPAKTDLIKAVNDIVELPNSEFTHPALNLQLLKLLKEDSTLKSEIERIVNDVNRNTRNNTVQGDQNVIGKVENVKNSNVSIGKGNITGDNNSVNKEEPD